jgi:hypothetical protein
MRGTMWKKVLLASVFLSTLGLVVGTASRSIGQEKKTKGRLPAYYGDVVNDAQRQSIYAIQEKYAKQIAALNEQLDTVTKQRDTEVENVLTPDQKEKLRQAREEASAKKKKNAEEKKGANEPPAAATANGDTKKPAATKKPK